MTTDRNARFVAFAASCVMTLALLLGVCTMATTDTAPAWMAKAAASAEA
jgi:hypothetical protein